MARFARRMAIGGPSAIFRASACAAAISVSGGWTALTIPSRSASCASMTSPVKISSQALAVPTTRGRKYVPPQSGCRPRLTKAWANFAAVDAMRMSQASARFIPAPAAAPLTAAMTGLGASRSASTVRSRPGATFSISGRGAPRALPSFIAFTSPPAQKPFPAPVTIMTRTSGSAAAAVTASCRSSRSVSPSALSRSGRFSVSVATPSLTSYSRHLYVIVVPPCRAFCPTSLAAASLSCGGGRLEQGQEGLGARREPTFLVVDDVEVPAHLQAAHAHRRQPSGRELALDRVHGHERDAESRHHRLLDGLGVIQLHNDLAAHTGLLQRTLRHVARGRPLLAHQERLVAELLHANLALLGPGMIAGHDQHDLVDQAGGHAVLAGAQHVAADHAKVELTRAHALLDRARVRDGELEVDPGIAGPEPGDDRGQYVNAGR